MIPGLFFTYDKHVDPAIFCLNQYARHWPDCPVNFIVPVNSEAAARKIRNEVSSRLAITIVEAPTPIRATLQTLNAAAGEADWVFWATSDRFLVGMEADAVNAVAREIARSQLAEIPNDVSGVRLLRWRDALRIDQRAEVTSIGGVAFRPTSAMLAGFWHPHFIRRRWLVDLAASLPDDCDLDGVQEAAKKLNDRRPSRPLITEKSIAKIEEPLRNGEITINFAARLGRRGQPVGGQILRGATVAFSCPTGGPSNTYWIRSSERIRETLSPLSDTPDLHVVSAGVGMRAVAEWLHPDVAEQDIGLVDLARRVPPVQPDGKHRFLYVFEDPRAIIAAVFAARERVRDFAMRHAQRVQASPGTMTEDWSLRDYLLEQTDIFRLEEHFDFWLFSEAPYEVIFVRRDALAKQGRDIARYLGAPVLAASPVNQDTAAWAADGDEARLMETLHGEFAQRLQRLPPVFSVVDGVTRSLDGQPIDIDLF